MVEGQRITLKQISEETGFAVITVSKALRGEKDVSQKTRDIICSKAREMGYVHNSAASSLRTGRSMMIAVSVININNPFWSRFCHTIQNLAFENNYISVFMNTKPESESEQRSINMMVRHGIDGVLLDPSIDCTETTRLLNRMGIPCVIVGSPSTTEDLLADLVTYDNYRAGYLVGSYLAQKGRTKLLFVDIPDPYAAITERLEGFRQGLFEQGFPLDNVVYSRLGPGQGASIETIKPILDAHPDIDGIYAFNDYSAMQMLSTLNKLGRRVPEDVMIVGNDNVQSYVEAGTRLTTIDSSPDKCARTAFEQLLRRINGDTTPPQIIRLPVRFIPGETA